MKKLLLFLAIPIYLFACKESGNDNDANNDNDDNGVDSFSIKKYPTYDPKYVFAMEKYYFDSVPKTKLNIVGVLEFDNPPIRQIMRNKQMLLIIVGAYLTDTLGKKKGDRALIVGFKEKGAFTYYDFTTIFPPVSASQQSGGGNVCPLPDPPCSIQGMQER